VIVEKKLLAFKKKMSDNEKAAQAFVAAMMFFGFQYGATGLITMWRTPMYSVLLGALGAVAGLLVGCLTVLITPSQFHEDAVPALYLMGYILCVAWTAHSVWSGHDNDYEIEFSFTRESTRSLFGVDRIHKELWGVTLTTQDERYD
jgi:hypothetical protein